MKKNNFVRWFFNTFLKQDYVRFKLNGNCTVTIKSYILLKSVQTSTIKALIKKHGYSSRDNRFYLVQQISVYLLESKTIDSTKSIVSCRRVIRRGKEKVFIDIEKA